MGDLYPVSERFAGQAYSAVISGATQNENSVVAAVTGKSIVVHAMFLTAYGTANTVYFKDAASGTAILGDGTRGVVLDKTGATGPPGFVLPFNPSGWCSTAVAGALIMNLANAQGVAGVVVYSLK